jgi:hypothetical protein
VIISFPGTRILKWSSSTRRWKLPEWKLLGGGSWTILKRFNRNPKSTTSKVSKIRNAPGIRNPEVRDI